MQTPFSICLSSQGSILSSVSITYQATITSTTIPELSVKGALIYVGILATGFSQNRVNVVSNIKNSAVKYPKITDYLRNMSAPIHKQTIVDFQINIGTTWLGLEAIYLHGEFWAQPFFNIIVLNQQFLVDTFPLLKFTKLYLFRFNFFLFIITQPKRYMLCIKLKIFVFLQRIFLLKDAHCNHYLPRFFMIYFILNNQIKNTQTTELDVTCLQINTSYDFIANTQTKQQISKKEKHPEQIFDTQLSPLILRLAGALKLSKNKIDLLNSFIQLNLYRFLLYLNSNKHYRIQRNSLELIRQRFMQFLHNFIQYHLIINQKYMERIFFILSKNLYFFLFINKIIKRKNMRFFLFFIFLVSLESINCLYTLKQTIIKGGLASVSRLMISANGSKIVTANQNKSIVIYVLNNGQYEFSQQIIGFESLQMIYISQDQSTIISTRVHSFQIYKFQSINNYILLQDQASSNLTRAKITEDLNNIITCGYNLEMQNYQYNGTNYVLIQTLTEMRGSIIDIYLTRDSQHLVCGGFEKKVRVYVRTGSYFNIQETFNANLSIFQINMSEDKEIITVAGVAGYVQVYKKVGTFIQQLSISASACYTMQMSSNPILFGFGGSSSQLNLYQRNHSTGLMNAYQNITVTQSIIKSIWKDDNNVIMAVGTNGNLYIYFECPFQFCLDCSLIFQCSQCESGFNLFQDGKCYVPGNEPSTNLKVDILSTINQNTNLTGNKVTTVNETINGNLTNSTNITSTVQNKKKNTSIQSQQYHNEALVCYDQLTVDQICGNDFCSLQCSKCRNSKYECIQCSKFYILAQNSQCQLESKGFQVSVVIFSIISIIRHTNLKPILLLIDDLWLYQYHKPCYYGVVQTVFEISRTMQQMKDQIITIPFLKKINDSIKQWDKRANEKYLKLQRKADSIPQNVIGYILQVIPFTIILFCLFKLLFHLLFDYPVSVYFRAISMNGFLPVALMQGNIQYFTFLGFRSISYLFAETWQDKLYSFFCAIFAFLIVFYIFSAYLLLAAHYKKLFKYFLENLFRIEGCILLMILTYCIRPFLRGLTHSSFYQSNEWQLIFLTLIDLLIYLILVYLEITKDIYKSKLGFNCLAVYLISSIPLNSLLWANTVYSSDTIIFPLVDKFSLIILIFRTILLIVNFLCNILALYKCQKDLKEQIGQEDQEAIAQIVNQELKSQAENRMQQSNNKQYKLHNKLKTEGKKNKRIPIILQQVNQ